MRQILPARILGCVLGIMLGMAPFCFGASTSTEQTTMHDVKRETAETVQAIKKYSAAQQDEAMKQAQAALQALDARIASLEGQLDKQWGQMNQSARQKAKATLAALRKQRNTVAEWYGGLQYGSVNAWEQMKQGFADAYAALQESWEKAQEALTNDQ